MNRLFFRGKIVSADDASGFRGDWIRDGVIEYKIPDAALPEVRYFPVNGAEEFAVAFPNRNDLLICRLCHRKFEFRTAENLEASDFYGSSLDGGGCFLMSPRGLTSVAVNCPLDGYLDPRVYRAPALQGPGGLAALSRYLGLIDSRRVIFEFQGYSYRMYYEVTCPHGECNYAVDGMVYQRVLRSPCCHGAFVLLDVKIDAGVPIRDGEEFTY